MFVVCNICNNPSDRVCNGGSCSVLMARARALTSTQDDHVGTACCVSHDPSCVGFVTEMMYDLCESMQGQAVEYL